MKEPRMNSIKITMTALLIFSLIITACGGDGNDPLGPGDSGLAGGKLTKGGNGANTVVTWDNYNSAFQELNEELIGAFNKAANTLSGSQPDGPVRIMGDHTGYAIIEDSVYFMVTNFTKEERMMCDFEVTFHDYSDAGSTFIGGVLECDGYFRLLTNKQIPFPVLEGEIKFAGPFSGSAKYHFFSILCDENDGHLLNIFTEREEILDLYRQGYIDFTSGGVTFQVMPYPERR
jgi:hypothetical protein